MRPIEDALEIILQHVWPVSNEVCNFLDSYGRVLQEELLAPYDFPRFSYSAMDGYAVRSEDLLRASEENRVNLRCVCELRASRKSEGRLNEGEAARIFTGAAIPEGADAVVMQENVEADGQRVLFRQPVKKGEAIRVQGEDMKAEEVLLSKGTILSAGEIGLLASIGRGMVQIARRPQVAILSCGDELMDLHEPLQDGKIMESNRYALAAQVRAAGGDPRILPLVKDNKEQIREQLIAGMQSDILLSSGGVSVGEYDYIRPVLKELDVNIHFWKVAMKPGKPVMFGSNRSCLFFALPGNPMSAMVTFEILVRPAIRKMMGANCLFHPRFQAQLMQPIRPVRGRVHFVRGLLSKSEEKVMFSPCHSQLSGNLLSMRGVDALAVLPAGTSRYEKDDWVDVLQLQTPSSGEAQLVPFSL